MDSDKIKASYPWTAEAYLLSARYHRRHELNRRGFQPRYIRIFINVLMSVGTVMGIVLLAYSGLSSSTWIGPMFILAGLVYWLGVKEPTNTSLFRAQFAKRPDNNVFVQWEFSQEAASIHTINPDGTPHSSATVEWKAFLKIVECEEGFLLFSLKNLYHWLPLSAFENPTDAATFREFVKASGVEHCYVVW